jgi:hypothetical protein
MVTISVNYRILYVSVRKQIFLCGTENPNNSGLNTFEFIFLAKGEFQSSLQG